MRFHLQLSPNSHASPGQTLTSEHILNPFQRSSPRHSYKLLHKRTKKSTGRPNIRHTNPRRHTPRPSLLFGPVLTVTSFHYNCLTLLPKSKPPDLGIHTRHPPSTAFRPHRQTIIAEEPHTLAPLDAFKSG
jgi:hypothetical protein